MKQRDAVIVEAVRTPIGKRNGALAEVHPVDLSAAVLEALQQRTRIDPAEVDDVVWGCVSQVGEQTFNVARTAVLAAGWPESVPGTTVDRQCGSSQQAIHFAAAGLVAGHYDLVVAGGVESMSRVPMGSAMANGDLPLGDRYGERYTPEFPNQGLSAELIADHWGFSRQELDGLALRSHERAAAATEDGRFAAQIVPVETPDGTVVDRDEGIRLGGTLEQLATLRTPFRDGGLISAANSSQISDGAAAVLMATSEKAKALGLEPIARIHSVAVVGSDPIMMLTGPIPATQRVLERAGLSIGDIGAFEVNEAFASIPLAWLRETGADPEALNPSGGAIALGHPLGCSGARLMTTLVHHLRDNHVQYGLQTMCEGGGQANATVVELVNG